MRRRAVLLALAAAPPSRALEGVVNRAGWREEAPLDATARRLADDPKENPYQCADGVQAAKEDWKVFGTNIGGWLVLEPWITPSLFYQFLSSEQKWGPDAPDHTGMDMWTFCAALGPKEANRQLRRHWAAWVREEDVRAIAATGATHVRIPVGDWMYKPYGPYVGCTDGALDELERLLALCLKYNLKALLDVHAVVDSQNGFDNSGRAMQVKWTAVTSQGDPLGYASFEHWPRRAANWIGEFDLESRSYKDVNHANINHTLGVIDKIVRRHASDPSVWGVQPVNEPWNFIPLEPLKQFYWDAYHIVRAGAKHWRYGAPRRDASA